MTQHDTAAGAHLRQPDKENSLCHGESMFHKQKTTITLEKDKGKFFIALYPVHEIAHWLTCSLEHHRDCFKPLSYFAIIARTLFINII